MPLHLKFRLRGSSQNLSYAAESCNIHSHGIQIITDAPLEPNMHVELWPEDEMGLHLRDYAEGTHYVHGDVCWRQKDHDSNKSTYGISFNRQIDWPIPMQALSEKFPPLSPVDIPSESVLDAMVDGVFSVDADWRITTFNKAAEDLTGWKRADAIGLHCHEVFKSNACSEGCVLAESMKNLEPVENRSVFITHAKGNRIGATISATPLTNKEGKILGGVQVFRKTQQPALSNQEEMVDVIGNSPAMTRIMESLPRIATSTSNVLIIGESGTGKAKLAQSLHRLSNRAVGPMITVNCSTLPSPLLEAELFGGQTKTGSDAKADRSGTIAAAEGGTLFLDEIGDISPAIQMKLLRILESQDNESIGANESRPADLRILAASSVHPEELIRANQFNEELLQRLTVVKIEIPPLRNRLNDIPLLLEHFIARLNVEKNLAIGGLADDTLRLLMQHDFPGNISELQNIIEHAFILCKGGLVLPEHLPASIKATLAAGAENLTNNKPRCLDDIEKQAIFSALKRNNWKRMKTCRELGISKDTLRRKISRYELLGKLQEEKVA